MSVDVSGQEAGQLVEYFGAKGQKYPFVSNPTLPEWVETCICNPAGHPPI